MKFRTIQSLGSRCQNSEILKHYDYREFSGFFDFMNTSKVSIIKHILSDNFNEILKESNNVSLICNQMTTDPETGNLLPTSVRTNNKFYNVDYNNVHSSLFPHHDLNTQKDKNHFIKCKERFLKLKNFNTLFNYSYNVWENNITDEDMIFFVNTLSKNYKFKNFKICFIGINLTNASDFKLVNSTDFYDVWLLNINHSFTGGLFSNDTDNQNYIKIIESYNIDNNRVSKDEIDNLNL